MNIFFKRIHRLQLFYYVCFRFFVSMALYFLNLSEDDLLETFSVDVCRASTNEVVNVETRKSPRKRISSEVFPAQDYRSFDELKRLKTGRGKDFVRVVESDKENVSELF